MVVVVVVVVVVGGGGGGCDDVEACDITSDKRAPPLAFATDSDVLESFDQFDLDF